MRPLSCCALVRLHNLCSGSRKKHLTTGRTRPNRSRTQLKATAVAMSQQIKCLRRQNIILWGECINLR
ncbi:hypothetical protein ZEAMMB73_Zm00001d019253 [Zea mays]|uniref:Uncharacterized protein n=1 Tax=Zea mays TaxID=4577 RepID=A0A1D6HWH0_MAIZE|nr:hypothetical protein ZEAMMB73_Zm00001d019253 [Zea mays]